MKGYRQTVEELTKDEIKQMIDGTFRPESGLKGLV
jgi:hypothetical protein